MVEDPNLKSHDPSAGNRFANIKATYQYLIEEEKVVSKDAIPNMRLLNDGLNCQCNEDK